MLQTIQLESGEITLLLRAAADLKVKHQNLAAIAASRSNKTKYLKNAAKLNTDHKQRADKATSLIDKITRQL